MLYCARAASWASISDEDAASVELWRLWSWLLQLHTPHCCLSADVPFTPSDLERTCHTGLWSKRSLDWKGMSYMADKGCQGSASSGQWRHVLRPRHAISQTWRRFKSKSQHLKKRTKRLFSVKNLVGFYYLWSIVANGAFKAVPSNCKICFPQYSVGFCCITLSLKYRQSSYQR